MAVAGPDEGFLEVRLGLSEVALDFGQAHLGSLNLASQAFLLAPQQVERDGVGVVGIQQLLAFAHQADQPALLHPSFALGIQTHARQFFFQEGPHVGQLLLGELDRRVVLDNLSLYLLDLERAQLAGCPLGLPTQADEVVVGAASAFGVADDQPGAALAAEDRALEVVRMVAVALPGQILGGHQLLDALPGVVIG